MIRMSNNIRSPIGLLVTRLIKERAKKGDKFFIRQLERELQAIIDAPTIEFIPLLEQPHPCPVLPEEMYPDMTDEEFELYEKNRKENEGSSNQGTKDREHLHAGGASSAQAS